MARPDLHYPRVVGQLCDLDVEGAHQALLRRVLLAGTPDEGVLDAFVVMVCISHLSRARVPSLFRRVPVQIHIRSAGLQSASLFCARVLQI